MHLKSSLLFFSKEKKKFIHKHTRRQTLLQLIRFIRVLQHQRVQEPMTSDFKFDLLAFFIAFYPRRYLIGFKNQ